MAKGNNILLAAVAGAVVAVVLTNYFGTEKGKELLNTASDKLKDFTGKATEYAKNNLGEVIRDTKNSLTGAAKEKLGQHVNN